MIVHYEDVRGQKRTAKFLERKDYAVSWMLGRAPSPCATYELDDGSIVQIPDHAWQLLNEITIEDHSFPLEFST